MKKTIYIFALTLCIFGITPIKSHAAEDLNINTPVIVELFTSQGCSSCPPADKILAELAASNKNIIALGCHVSYWNHLKWKDTLSQEFCDIRQHGIQGIRKERKIYTPQMVVNGKYVFIGSNTAKLSFALHSAQESPLLPITTTEESNLITITLPQAKTGDYRIWGFGYKDKVTTNIGNGENTGRVIDYTHPVITYSNLGPWNGTANTLSFERPEGDIDGITIFAQSEGYGEIVAAGKLQF
ncbi:MAG: DUF1223 domain-containing protein [Alphaproteobacteria bacterium]